MDLAGPVRPRTLGGEAYILNLFDVFTLTLNSLGQSSSRQNARQQRRSWSGYPSHKVRLAQKCKSSDLTMVGNSHPRLSRHGWQAKASHNKPPLLNLLRAMAWPKRLNRTLQDKCKTMMIGAQLPNYLWGDVLEAANMLRNITPVSMACTPLQKWTRRKPDLSKLRVIDSKDFFQIEKLQRDGKFAPVAYMGAPVNYNLSSNSYRVWDPSKTSVYNVGEPAFDETANAWMVETTQG